LREWAEGRARRASTGNVTRIEPLVPSHRRKLELEDDAFDGAALPPGETPHAALPSGTNNGRKLELE
jgi:hypothetical protein